MVGVKRTFLEIIYSILPENAFPSTRIATNVP